MPTIFDFMNSNNIVAYWNEMLPDEPPYATESLFPDKKKLGLDLAWIKGSRGLPVTLKASAFDAQAIPRTRAGFDMLKTNMPYFKESSTMDEEIRQQLNMAMQSSSQSYIDSLMQKVFDDELSLLRGARATRELLRMDALTTGVISIEANGQEYTFDYGVTNKGNAKVSWSESATADPIEDIRAAQDTIQQKTGVKVTRAMCNGATWRNLRNCDKIKNSIYVLAGGKVSAINDTTLKQHIIDELGIEVVVNDKRYSDGVADSAFMPTNTFVMFPSGDLGSTWFGTTPAESDLMAGSAANVTITETGVAVVSAKKVDPVQVETIVSMICLPSFEQADKVYIMDTVAK